MSVDRRRMGTGSGVHRLEPFRANALGLFSAIDSRASAVVVMAGCRTLSSPHGDRASAAVLLVGGLLCEVMAGALWCCVASVFGAVGCSRAGETAGISRFAAGPVLDRSFRRHPARDPSV